MTHLNAKKFRICDMEDVYQRLPIIANKTAIVVYFGHAVIVPLGAKYITTDDDGMIQVFDTLPHIVDNVGWHDAYSSGVMIGIFNHAKYEDYELIDYAESLRSIEDILYVAPPKVGFVERIKGLFGWKE